MDILSKGHEYANQIPELHGLIQDFKTKVEELGLDYDTFPIYENAKSSYNRSGDIMQEIEVLEEVTNGLDKI